MARPLKEYQQGNVDKQIEKSKKYYHLNKEKILARKKEVYEQRKIGVWRPKPLRNPEELKLITGTPMCPREIELRSKAHELELLLPNTPDLKYTESRIKIKTEWYKVLKELADLIIVNAPEPDTQEGVENLEEE